MAYSQCKGFLSSPTSTFDTHKSCTYVKPSLCCLEGWRTRKCTLLPEYPATKCLQESPIWFRYVLIMEGMRLFPQRLHRLSCSMYIENQSKLKFLAPLFPTPQKKIGKTPNKEDIESRMVREAIDASKQLGGDRTGWESRNTFLIAGISLQHTGRNKTSCDRMAWVLPEQFLYSSLSSSTKKSLLGLSSDLQLRQFNHSTKFANIVRCSNSSLRLMLQWRGET